MTAEDQSFRSLLTQPESGGESVRHSRGACDAMASGGGGTDRQLRGGLRHSGGAWPYLWRTESSSVKKGRFSEGLSAFRGRTLGILGAHNGNNIVD